MAGSLPEGKQTTCECPPAFERDIGIDPTGCNVRVAACLRCGNVTCAEAGVDEPRAGDIRLYGYHQYSIPELTHAWLAQWPRLIRNHDKPWVLLPSTLRCSTVDALSKEETRAAAKQQSWNAYERYWKADIPTEPPPSLPSDLHLFGSVWQALQFTPQSNPEDLVRYAYPGYHTSDIAVALLRQRADVKEILQATLASTDGERFITGLAIARTSAELTAVALPGVLQELRTRPFTENPDLPGRVGNCMQFEMMLGLLKHTGSRSGEVESALRGFRSRVLKRDLELVRKINSLLAPLTP